MAGMFAERPRTAMQGGQAIEPAQTSPCQRWDVHLHRPAIHQVRYVAPFVSGVLSSGVISSKVCQWQRSTHPWPGMCAQAHAGRPYGHADDVQRHRSKAIIATSVCTMLLPRPLRVDQLFGTRSARRKRGECLGPACCMKPNRSPCSSSMYAHCSHSIVKAAVLHWLSRRRASM